MLVDGENREPHKSAGTAESDNVIESRNLWKVFGPRAEEAVRAMKTENLSRDEVASRFDCIVAVADASFSVARGQVFCIMGLSGSGKSTVLRHVNGLVKPTAGTILVNGKDVATLTPPGVRRLRSKHIGMVFQDFALLSHRSAVENVAFGLELRGEPLEKRLRIAEDKLALVGLQGWSDRQIDELSGGMKQRIGIARALASDPDILLMDEPFSALDPLIRRQLQDQFIELSRAVSKTTIFITHDLDEAMRVGDVIAIMRDGRIIQTGTPSKILLEPADEYVAQFVGGLSPMHVLTVGDICRQLAERRSNPDEVRPRVASDTILVDAIDFCSSIAGIIDVTDRHGRVLGQMDRELLLTSLRPLKAMRNV